MNAINYLEKAKEKLGIKSDYALAKWLGISRFSLSSFTTGRRPLDDYTATRIAEALGINPMEIIAARNAEREKDETRKEFWRRIFTGSLTACLVMGILAFESREAKGGESGRSAHYAQSDKAGGGADKAGTRTPETHGDATKW